MTDSRVEALLPMVEAYRLWATGRMSASDFGAIADKAVIAFDQAGAPRSPPIAEWPLIRWRGQVASAIRGKRGQAFLRELLAALDAMPTKRLVANDLQDAQGEVCTLGCIAKARNVDTTGLTDDGWADNEAIAERLGIAHQLVTEIEFMNDDWTSETPEQRWVRMRAWVAEQIVGVETPQGNPSK